MFLLAEMSPSIGCDGDAAFHSEKCFDNRAGPDWLDRTSQILRFEWSGCEGAGRANVGATDPSNSLSRLAPCQELSFAGTESCDPPRRYSTGPNA